MIFLGLIRMPQGIVRSDVGGDLYSLRGRGVGKVADQEWRRPKGTMPPAGCGIFASRQHPYRGAARKSDESDKSDKSDVIPKYTKRS